MLSKQDRLKKSFHLFYFKRKKWVKNLTQAEHRIQKTNQNEATNGVRNIWEKRMKYEVKVK